MQLSVGSSENLLDSRAPHSMLADGAGKSGIGVLHWWRWMAAQFGSECTCITAGDVSGVVMNETVRR
ncbi:hypothetical protein E2C01_028202 [Portunus trituberculatus]|uniref:Uncharacterized protein n=1 Tax=Portunus trituberculatus TaxID=210409 RepID=A0A5B7EK17_PORTR|nr:hypothetical protein [Portunus trituberculatus]